MKIICPIAGVGSELQPFVISKPKGLIKIAGMRIIDHGLNLLKHNFPQGTELIFIIGYKKEIIRPYLEDEFSDYFNLKFEIQEPIGLHGEIPYFSGIGDAIALAKPHVSGEDCFIFFSDHLPTEPFEQMFSGLEEKTCDGLINVRKVGKPQYYGVCVTDQKGVIRRVVEKPSTEISNLAITWGYTFSHKITPRMFELLEEQSQQPPVLQKSHSITAIIQKLIDEGACFKAHLMESPILDFGRITDFLDGNEYLLTHPDLNACIIDNQGKSIHPTAEIKNTSIIPPIYIGEKTIVENSVIGPNVSIGTNSHLKQCILSDTVIGDEALMKNIISQKSLIGDFVTIEDLIKPHLSLGDSSTLAEFNE